MPKVDYIIIGQGMAGTCLALEFFKRRKSFLVIDHPYPNSASRIAAGLFNPITGRTNQSTWKADQIFPYLKTFYTEAEKILTGKFLTMLPVYRPFISVEEQTRPIEQNRQWIRNFFLDSQFKGQINDPFGGIEFEGSGFLNAATFLFTARKMFLELGAIDQSKFDSQELQAEDVVRYKNIEAARIIFCDGVEANSNPWFHWLPVRKLKGELLSVKANLPIENIINRGVFSVPTEEEGQFVVGSTYHHDLTEGFSESGVDEIISKARKLFKSELEITLKSWGHRPSTVDRRPIIGQHPKNKNICTLNGLGTKGVSLAPYFAGQMADWLEGKMDLDKEANIQRFYSLYFNL